MTSIVNLFSNFDDLTKKKSVTDLATEYKKNKREQSKDSMPALNQGEKFKKYQKKIKKNLEKKIEENNFFKEGFEGIQELENNLQLNRNGLTEQSNNIIQNNNYSSQQQNIDYLRQEYKNTLDAYENLLAQINGTTSGYLNRVNPDNPYLNKTLRFTTGQIAYVTNKGVVKYIPSTQIWNSVNVPQQYTQLDIPWDESWNVSGVSIPTNPPLVSGTPMKYGQSVGNEGSNVFVNKLITNPNTTELGVYADNQASPLMTFIGGAPPPPVSFQNGNFDQPQISANSYQYINSSSQVPGWQFDAVLVNSSSAWGYPTPYPNGNQCACIQKTQSISQTVNLVAGVKYTLSFTACGRNCCDGSGESNPIEVKFVFDNGEAYTPIYKFQPPVNKWTNYSTTFTVNFSSNHQLTFQGKWTAGDRSTAIQNIQLHTGRSSSTGSYTYNECQQAAIDGGYQYFGLQGSNPTTSKSYCTVSNSQPAATSLGTGWIPSAEIGLWAADNPGSTATLTNTGALTVFNSGGQAVFSTPNANAQPSNFLGCYGDNPNRAMELYNGGSQQYNLEQCQEIAKQQGSAFFGLQNSTSGNNAQCALSSDFSQASEYGKAGNCTQISDGSWSGGGWSNAVYNTTLPQSNYFLILQDDGNMCIYRGTSPTDNQGLIWAAGTNGQQQNPNPNYAAAKGKYGTNWIASGSTLAAGDFVGSNNGDLALIMQPDGYLVLFTFSMMQNYVQMNDGNLGAGVGANTIYDIGEVGISNNMTKLAYIDQNSELHPYPADNTQYTDSYTEMQGTYSQGGRISGEITFGNSLQTCEKKCSEVEKCAGFAHVPGKLGYCELKNSQMYPNSSRQILPYVNLYIRNKKPISTPIGVPSTTNNIDSITYKNYIDGGALGNEYGLANATNLQKQQLEQLQSQMNMLSNQISNLTGDFGSSTQEAEAQSQKNVQGIQDYLKDMKTTNKKIKTFPTTVENILKDSDIVVLQKNYNYLFWSILAVGTVLVAMNIVKK
jgi:hypothetical protein